MAVMVTGGAGFVGAYLVRDLLHAGQRVVVYDVQPEHNTLSEVLSPQELREMPVVAGDVTDLAQLLRTMRQHHVRRVVDLAYLLMAEAEANPPAAARVNNIGRLNVLEAARILDLDRVVWSSSIAMLGHPEAYGGPLPDNAAPYPTSVYGMCIAFNEYMGQHYWEHVGVQAAGLRHPLVFGPGRKRGAGQFIEELLVRPARGQPGLVPYGDDTFSWLYVEDCAASLVAALKADRLDRPLYNCGGPVATVAALRDIVLSLLPESDIQLLPGYLHRIAFDYDQQALQAQTGWAPRTSLREGIRRTINWERGRLRLPPVD